MTHPEPPAPQGLPRREFLKMAAGVGGSLLALNSLAGLTVEAKPKASSAVLPPVYQPHTQVEAIDFAGRFATVEGISQNQLKQHDGLYRGYVKKINEIQNALQNATPDLATVNATYDPFRSLHVEQTFALNGVVLHELYFGNLGGPRTAPSARLQEVMAQEFGSWQNYITHLKAVGKAFRGWALTAFNLRDGRIHNYGLDLHNQLVPVFVVPLLVLDVYEHAYMIDFGTNRPAYLDAFLANIDWAPVEKRLQAARQNHAHAWPV